VTDRDAIIEAIYEAAAMPDRWPHALQRFGETVPTPGIVLLTQRSDSWVGHKASPMIEQPLLQYLATDIPARSQTTSRLLAADHAGFVDEGTLFTAREWESEPFRREWAHPLGLNHCAATARSACPTATCWSATCSAARANRLLRGTKSASSTAFGPISRGPPCWPPAGARSA
jgi:hypothetical protein